MLFTEDFSDIRQKAWCIHCGDGIANTVSNRDHVPTKSLLSKNARYNGADFDKGKGDPHDYLPQVEICQSCNSNFSADENYLLCVLHAVMAGTLYPDPKSQKEAYDVLRSNRNVVRELRSSMDHQMWLVEELNRFAVTPDLERIGRVVLKNARGHALHELGEPKMCQPDHLAFLPLEFLCDAKRAAFEDTDQPSLSGWPEVGSRMMQRVLTGDDMVSGWIEVEPGRYRYKLNWDYGITVKSVIWEYLATETRWFD